MILQGAMAQNIPGAGFRLRRGLGGFAAVGNGIGFCCLLLSLLFAPPAHGEKDWNVNGYGTLGYTWDDSPDNSFIRDLSQRPEDYFHTNGSWRRDTRLGLQATYRLNPTMEVQGQVVVRDQWDDEPLSFLDWAYLGLHPSDSLDLRLGRVGYDVFLMSDHRNLGFSYPWVRPPVEFYGLVPIYSLDGGDVAYSWRDQDTTWRLKAQAGHGGLGFPMGPSKIYEFESDRVWVATLSREQGPWRLQAGFSYILPSSEASPLAPLHAGLEAVAGAGIPGVSAEARDLREQSTYLGTKVHFATLGFSYDTGVWLAQAELGRMTSGADMVSNGNMAYAALARRFGDWTPFVMISGIRSLVDLRKPETDWSRFNLGELQAGAVTAVNATRMNQDTTTLGVRFDVHDKAAIKLQWDSSLIEANGYGLWYNNPAKRDRDERVNLFSLNLDFFF